MFTTCTSSHVLLELSLVNVLGFILHELVAVPASMFTFAVVAFFAGMGTAELWPSLIPAELVAIGIMWTATMGDIAEPKTRTIICFTRHPWLMVLTLPHLIYPFHGHMRY